MDDITTTTAEGGNTTPDTGARTFSQDDVNKIVSDRLAKEKAKLAAEIAQREKDLAHEQFKMAAEKRLAGTKLPLETVDVLKLETIEELDAVLAFLGKCRVIGPVRDEGAPHSVHATSPDSDVRRAMGLK